MFRSTRYGLSCALIALFSALMDSALSETLYRAEYQYDPRGFVTNLLEEYALESTVRELQYDRSGQLIQEKIGSYMVQYEYDSLGNRIRKNRSGDEQVCHYNARNEMLQQDLPGITRLLYYDLNGSLTQKVEGVLIVTYNWDSRGRLTQVYTNGVSVFQASYAGGLNRQRKTEGDSSRVYRYDGSTAIEEVDESGVLKELVRVDRGAFTVGGILYSADRRGTNTYTYNGVGSTVVLSDSEGVQRIVKYDAFGNVLDADEGVEAERLANTKELDQITGLYFHGARYFDAAIGRYISMDPARDGVNHYVYANNAPLSYVDPTGLAGRNGPGMPEPRVLVPEEYQEEVNRAILDLIPGAGATMGWADIGFAASDGNLGLASLMLVGMVIPGDKIASFALRHSPLGHAFEHGSEMIGRRFRRKGSFSSISDESPSGAGGGHLPKSAATTVRALDPIKDAEKLDEFFDRANAKGLETMNRAYSSQVHEMKRFIREASPSSSFLVSETNDGEIDALVRIRISSLEKIESGYFEEIDPRQTQEAVTVIQNLLGTGGGSKLMAEVARRTLEEHRTKLVLNPLSGSVSWYTQFNPSQVKYWRDSPENEVKLMEWDGQALEKLVAGFKQSLE